MFACALSEEEGFSEEEPFPTKSSNVDPALKGIILSSVIPAALTMIYSENFAAVDPFLTFKYPLELDKSTIQSFNLKPLYVLSPLQ